MKTVSGPGCVCGCPLNEIHGRKILHRQGQEYDNVIKHVVIFMFIVSQFRFVYAVFCLTAILILAVYLRDANNRIFYRLCTHRAELSQLKQELGAKQLQLESLINPAAVSQRMNELNDD